MRVHSRMQLKVKADSVHDVRAGIGSTDEGIEHLVVRGDDGWGVRSELMLNAAVACGEFVHGGCGSHRRAELGLQMGNVMAAEVSEVCLDKSPESHKG